MSPEEMRLDMLVAELDYENRLLRARNERLEREAEQRKRLVSLTDQEIRDWWRIENGLEDCKLSQLQDFTLAVRAIELKLREKNQ